MSDSIELLEARVAYLEALCEGLMLSLWHERGELKGISGKIEKELEPFMQKYLDEKKAKVNV